MKHKVLSIIAALVILAACFTPVAASSPADAVKAPAASTNIQYTVQSGDTLNTIATYYCTTWQEIYNLNYQTIGSNPNVIYPGMVLTVPANCNTSSGGTAPTPTPTPPPANGCYDRGPQMYATGTYLAPYYTVAWGDTLAGIGQRFGIPYENIMSANGLTSPSIYAGEVLYIPCSTSTTPPPTTGGTAERVSFDYGATSATRTGTISNAQPKTYVLTAFAGQTMTIVGSSHGEPLNVTLKNSYGQVIPLSGTNNAINFNVYAKLPATDDYFVTFTPTTQPESPSLTFTVTFYIQ
jgi:LysM repeat protein